MSIVTYTSEGFVEPPARANRGDAGYDLRAAEDAVLAPGEVRLISTGISVQLPEGWAMLVLSRSGTTLRKKLVVANSPGLIDSGYRGEVGIILHNIGREVQAVEKGERVAQAVFIKPEFPTLIEVDALEESDRGQGGFGSTGTA